MKQITSTPRPGWARATDVVSPDLTNELSRLSSENAELRAQLQVALRQAEDDEIAERRKIIQTMKKNNITVPVRYEYEDTWENKRKVSLYRLFYLLASEIMIEKSTEDVMHFIGIMLNPDKNFVPHEQYPVPLNYVRNWISDFIALGLFELSQRRHSVSDIKEYWSLTDQGREVYTDIRRARLEEGISEPTDPESTTPDSDES